MTATKRMIKGIAAALLALALAALAILAVPSAASARIDDRMCAGEPDEEALEELGHCWWGP